MQATSTSGSALLASQNWLDTIANNLANVGTNGYSAESASFADTFTQALSANATGGASAPRYTPPGWWGGTGVLDTATAQDFTEGPQTQTGNATDLAISGGAFFLVQTPNGAALTRDGHFHFSPMAGGKSMLVTAAGNPVLDVAGKPIVATTAQAERMTVGADGQITWGGTPATQGPRIAMATVPVPDDTLVTAGNNLYQPTQGTVPLVANTAPGASGGNVMAQGFLTGSNVNMTTAMTDMIAAQRMFDMNAEALNMTNEMNQVAVTIKP